MAKNNIDKDSELESAKPVKEIPIIHDQGAFKHETGDTYEGFFEAKKKDRSVKMHGPGIYTTAEGDAYTGTWETDRLGVDNVNITYADGSKYEGQFKEWSYSGAGKYTYPDGSVLLANFSENSPVHVLTLIDPNGHTWLGTAEQGFGWCDPVNHFYDMLEKCRESKMKRFRSSVMPVMVKSTVLDVKGRKSVEKNII